MTQNLLRTTDANQPEFTPATPDPAEAPPHATEAEVVPLPHVLRQVARDSRTNPAQYLDETRVIGGGE
jgi:hypothetical protein